MDPFDGIHIPQFDMEAERKKDEEKAKERMFNLAVGLIVWGLISVGFVLYAYSKIQQESTNNVEETSAEPVEEI